MNSDKANGDANSDKAAGAARPESPLLSLMGCGILIGVLIMILDFFDVGFADGRGPGIGVIIFGLGISSLVFEGLHTGSLPILGGFIIRDVVRPVFWVSLAIYALAAITMIVVGCLMLFGAIES